MEEGRKVGYNTERNVTFLLIDCNFDQTTSLGCIVGRRWGILFNVLLALVVMESARSRVSCGVRGVKTRRAV